MMLGRAVVVLCLLLLGLAISQMGALEPRDAQLDSGEYFDIYPYDGQAGERISIALSSSTFDPYLLVLDPEGNVLLNVDDSEGAGLNVLETITLPADGSYTIVVTSVLAGETGAYTLNIQSMPSPQTGSISNNVRQGRDDPAQREVNIVQGRVTDEQGDPIPTATITIAGYTGVGGNVVERVMTDAQGNYRTSMPSGLYTLSGEAELTFNGETYFFYLHPADENCEAAYSERGIVKDFVLKLSGFKECLTGPDRNNYNSYSGGTISINRAYPRNFPDDAVVIFTLTPQGLLADGSQGQPLTFTRTILAITSGYSPLDDTGYLYDIPLGNYRLTAQVTLPGGTTQEVYFGGGAHAQASTSHDVNFEAVRMWPYGIRVTSISLYEAP